MQSVLIYFLLFLLPFIIFPFGSSFFEIPKVLTSEILILILFIHFLMNKKLSKLGIQKNLQKITRTSLGALSLLRFRIPNHLLLFLMLLFILIQIARGEVSLFGNAFRGQGVLLAWIVIVFGYLSSRIIFKPPRRVMIIFFLLLHVILAVFLGSSEGRAVGTIGEPNSFAAMGIFLWPFLLSPESQGTKKTKQYMAQKVTVGKAEKIFGRMRHSSLLTIGFIMSLLIIIFSGSRSGFIAICLQGSFFFLIKFLSMKKAILIAILLLGASLLLPLLDNKTVYENRGEIWKAALLAGYEHPISGWGYGNTEVALKEYNHKLFNRLQGYYVDSSHNFFLDTWIQGGIIGLILLMTLIIESLRMSLKKKETKIILILMGLISVMSFNPVSVVIILQLWWSIGQAMKVEGKYA